MIISRLRPIRERRGGGRGGGGGGGVQRRPQRGPPETGHALMRGKAGKRGRWSRSLPYYPSFLIGNSI